MPEPSRYWERFWRKRVSRRRLLAGAALGGSGLAAAAVIGCGTDEGSPGASPEPEGSPVDLGAVEPSDARQPFIPAPAGMNGGTLRYVNADPVILDRFDPHQTQFSPMYANHSAVFSKLYRYASHEEPTWANILPDLAESAPEMIGDPPDTYVINLRRGVKFHDNDRVRRNFPGLAGRELTADDIIFSFDRQRNPNSPNRVFYYRSSQYDTIDRIEKVDDYTLRITTKGPVAPFFHFLADTNAFIIPREIVDLEPGPDGKPWDSVDSYQNRGPKPEERMIGSGPFMWDELKWGVEFKAVRNPNWFGWGDPDLARPYIDGYLVSGTFDDSSSEALFRAKKIDSAGWLANPNWVFNVKQEMPELVLYRVQITPWVNSRIKVYCSPFSDVRVRKALHLAADRQQVIDVIWKGEAKMVGPVGAGIRYWALPQEELEGLPGYRQTRAEREQDIADARAAYEAAGSPELPQIWFADQPSYIPAFAASYAETLTRNLGVEISTVIRAYAFIAEGQLRDCDQAAMTWAFDNGWIDLDDWVYPYFRTGAPKNSFRVSDPELDSLLDAQRREFDSERRKELGYEIQRYLLGGKGDKPGSYVRLDYAAFASSSVSWPYFKNRVTFPSAFGNNYYHANVWLDRNDPSFAGRPA